MVRNNWLLNLLVGVFVLVGIALFARPGEAGGTGPDLTGTWQGKQKCDDFDGEADKFQFESTMEISQIDHIVDMNVDGFFLYRGRVIPDDSDASKGEVGYIECATDPTLDNFAEIGRAKVGVKDGKGNFKATSHFINPPDFGTGVGTCKWTYKRTSTEDPGVDNSGVDNCP